MQHLIHRIHPLKILCVEDTQSVQKRVKAAVKQIHSELVFRSSGSEGVHYFRRHDVDVVLLDLALISQDAYDAFKQIRISGRQGYKAPIIAMAEKTNGLPESAFRRLGFNGLYIKPVEPYRLIATIDQALLASGHDALFKISVVQ